jgi:hypothetical protein
MSNSGPCSSKASNNIQLKGTAPLSLDAGLAEATDGELIKKPPCFVIAVKRRYET